MERKTVQTADEGTSTSVTSILETARTPDGRWYPKRIRTEFSSPNHKGQMSRHVEEKRILVDTDHKFEDGVFSGASLE